MILPSASLRDHLDSKLVTTRLGNEVGAPSVPNILVTVDGYDELINATTEAGLGSDLVIQTAYGDSGKTTFFIDDEAGWKKNAKEIVGTEDPKSVTGVRVKHTKTGAITKLPTDGVFIAIGHSPATSLFKGQLELNHGGYVITRPDSTATAIPGVYAAGDVKDEVYRQAVTAAAMGCMAALEAERPDVVVGFVHLPAVDQHANVLAALEIIDAETAEHLAPDAVAERDAVGEGIEARDGLGHADGDLAAGCRRLGGGTEHRRAGEGESSCRMC